MKETLETYFMIAVLFGGLGLYVFAQIYILINPSVKKKRTSSSNSDVSNAYRHDKQKLMYKQLARSEEVYARIENEVRDKLKNK